MGTNAEVLLRPATAAAGPDAGHGISQSDAGGTEIARTAEAGTSALEAQARAVVQARFWIARQNERLWDQVEQRLIRECKRPGFAKSAWFILPIGNDPNKYPAGFTIRFAEAALRLCGNIDIEQTIITDDPWKRTVRVRVLDLETNFAYTTEVVIDKTVERGDPKGREVLTHRQNSYGKLVYVVTGTEQEVAMKQGSMVSKAIRTSGLRLVPGDILDECKRLVLATIKEGINKEDPENARKAILDNFAELGVMPADIAKYVEHGTDNFLPAERELLRGVYAAIRDGHVTWKDVMEAKFGSGDAEESEGAKKLKEVLEKRKSSTTGQTTTTPAAKQPNPGDPSPTTQPTAAPAATTTTPTQQQPTQAPTGDQPPANLQDLSEFPETSEPDWCKVKGVIYRRGDTGYREWKNGGTKPVAKGRRDLEFGS